MQRLALLVVFGCCLWSLSGCGADGTSRADSSVPAYTAEDVKAAFAAAGVEVVDKESGWEKALADPAHPLVGPPPMVGLMGNASEGYRYAVAAVVFPSAAEAADSFEGYEDDPGEFTRQVENVVVSVLPVGKSGLSATPLRN